LARLDVEEKARAKDAPPRAPEGQSSANVMQQAGKKKQKANQTTQFNKKKMNMDEVVCLVCGETRCKVQMARGGVNSLFKNLQASLNNHVSIKDG
jgi:hypothetical protein